MALVFLMGTNCLKIEKRLDPSAILSALGGNSYFLFLSDQPNGGSPRTLLTYRTDGTLQLQSWNGGPGNIIKGVVANGVIFALDGSTNDTIWMSRDQGKTWESWTNSTPQSSAFQRLAACNGTVIATYGSIAYSSGSNPKGYFSADQGGSFSPFYVSSGATSSPSVTGLDCNSEYAFITIGYGNRLFRASMTDLTSWSNSAINFSGASYPSSYQDPVSSDSGLIVFAPITTLYMDHSTNQGVTPLASGGFPVGVVRLSGGADFSASNYYIGMIDSSFTDRCRVYKTATGSESPSSMTQLAFNCGSASDLGIPSVYADDTLVLVSYRYNSQASTGLHVSTDGANFTNVDLSSVWTSSGYITSIARAR